MNTLTRQTRHFKCERMQQRGIPPEFPYLAIRYGEVFARDTTANAIYFSKRSISRMIKDGVASRLIREVEDRPNVRFIVSKESGDLLTVEYAYAAKQRIKRDVNTHKRTGKFH